MSAMIGDMLFIAEAEQSSVRRDASGIDLNAEIRGFFDYFEAWAEDRGVRLELGGQVGKIAGDWEMSRRALSNLIVNPIRYTQHGQSVHVRLSQGSGGSGLKYAIPASAAHPSTWPICSIVFIVWILRASDAAKRQGSAWSSSSRSSRRMPVKSRSRPRMKKHASACDCRGRISAKFRRGGLVRTALHPLAVSCR